MSGGVEKYKQIEQLSWSREERKGSWLKLKTFLVIKGEIIPLLSTDRTDYIVTNDLSQNSTDEVQEANAVRWKVEEFHRGVKQLTGIEACQCRKARIQRNHIACAILAWTNLKDYLSWPLKPFINWNTNGFWVLDWGTQTPSIPMQLVWPLYLVSLRKSCSDERHVDERDLAKTSGVQFIWSFGNYKYQEFKTMSRLVRIAHLSWSIYYTIIPIFRDCSRIWSRSSKKICVLTITQCFIGKDLHTQLKS